MLDWLLGPRKTDEELLVEILAAPDSDEPRLALAEQLEKRGDPRGELIRIQCEIARDGNTAALSSRERELLAAHEKEWAKAAGIRGALTTFRRGFPHVLIGNVEELLASRQALETQPIVALSVTSGQARLAELAALPELSRVRELTITGDVRRSSVGSALPVAAFEALADSPHLFALQKLVLERHALDAAGACVLANAPWIALLQELAIRGSVIGAEGATALLPRLRMARILGLDECEIADEGAAALASSSLRALEELHVRKNRIGAEGATVLADSPVLATVTRLDLNGNYAQDLGACALAQSHHVARVRELGLDRNGVTAAGAKALAASTALASLEKLDLHGNRIGLAGVGALASGTGLRSLKHLGITGNEVYTGEQVTWESGLEAAGDLSGGVSEVEETRDQLARRFAHRTGLIIS